MRFSTLLVVLALSTDAKIKVCLAEYDACSTKALRLPKSQYAAAKRACVTACVVCLNNATK